MPTRFPRPVLSHLCGLCGRPYRGGYDLLLGDEAGGHVPVCAQCTGRPSSIRWVRWWLGLPQPYYPARDNERAAFRRLMTIERKRLGRA